MVFRQWFDGYPGDDTQTRIRDLKFNPLRFVIENPADAAQFPLSQNNYRETESIQFRVSSEAQTAAVDWTADLEYQMKRSTTTQRDTFQTQPNTAASRTYLARGGQITVRATSTVNGTPVSAGPLKFFVVGVAIPDGDITARLSSLYGGATQNLLTGIAYVESTYRQFAQRNLYGVTARWPTESHDGGSHIGLMQVPVTFADAWDWHVNTETGARFFRDKLAAAGRIQARVREDHPQLRALTAVELENMALLLYGPHATGDRMRQYYAPRTTGSTVDWVVNTEGNPEGVGYVDRIRTNIR